MSVHPAPQLGAHEALPSKELCGPRWDPNGNKESDTRSPERARARPGNTGHVTRPRPLARSSTRPQPAAGTWGVWAPSGLAHVYLQLQKVLSGHLRAARARSPPSSRAESQLLHVSAITGLLHVSHSGGAVPPPPISPSALLAPCSKEPLPFARTAALDSRPSPCFLLLPNPFNPFPRSIQTLSLP